MVTHPIHHNPHEHDASFTSPTALMLDTRVAPLERNGCPRRASLVLAL